VASKDGRGGRGDSGRLDTNREKRDLISGGYVSDTQDRHQRRRYELVTTSRAEEDSKKKTSDDAIIFSLSSSVLLLLVIDQ
jgi:hypothetical protein